MKIPAVKWFLKWSTVVLILLFCCTCVSNGQSSMNYESLITYIEKQAKATGTETWGSKQMPVYIEDGNKTWTTNSISNWRSGFWPGIEWYLYESTRNEYWKREAEKSTAILGSILDLPAYSHDIGFQFYCSYGNGYRLTGNPLYKQILLRAADSLATLYNPTVGTILSWPRRVREDKWPHHTIVDNMMNLELLFWAAKNSDNKKLFDIASKHAEVTMKNHFRPDYSSYHVMMYDGKSGEVIKGVTHQGYSDNSMWARGQAWAIYGFTMCYRETKRPDFLTTAINSANIYLKRLPADHIPFWDFDDPAIPNTVRDASAAAIVASALLELSTFVHQPELQMKYRKAAENMLQELSTDKYLSGEANHAFLLHSTGNKPTNKEIDMPLIYADYYYLEALLRLDKMKKNN